MRILLGIKITRTRLKLKRISHKNVNVSWNVNYTATKIKRHNLISNQLNFHVSTFCSSISFFLDNVNLQY